MLTDILNSKVNKFTWPLFAGVIVGILQGHVAVAEFVETSFADPGFVWEAARWGVMGLTAYFVPNKGA